MGDKVTDKVRSCSIHHGKVAKLQERHAAALYGRRDACRYSRSGICCMLLRILLLNTTGQYLVVAIGAPIAVFRTERARSEAESARFDAERHLYAADMKLASQAVRDGAVDHARQLLNRHGPKPGAADLRGFEWRYLWWATAQHEVVRTLAGLPSTSANDSVKLARVGDTLYNLDYSKSELRAWNMTDWTSLPLRWPSHLAFDRWFWCPYQQTALAVDNTNRTLTLYQLPGFEKGHVIPLRGLATRSAISPDRRLLAVCFQDGDRERVSVWDLQTNAERSVLGEYSARVVSR